ncbi:pectinesterase family protein [Clostridium lacusfryxellense]|uniref:pectinesterase family protein n=1 Tax=Clostridium lacusfryxellense TaxID=205328 RepID=UPI001C0E1E38|nr:pectinesterase family protein [Clostridium lacusfryxellense]MBU3114105.1 pectin methylesterase [Clostridium lacusfryxellense]
MIVAKDGSGDFNTVQEAINSIPFGNQKRIVINIKNGIYKEKIFVDMNNIMLIGENEFNTILTYDDHAYKLFPNGEKMGTFNSFSTFIGGDNFIAQNITFENSSGCGDTYGQAVAIYVDGDKAKFKDCEIFSNNRDKSVNGYITAASTIEGERFGYVFIDCKLLSDAKPNSVYLGRPWRDYAKTTFINCFMGEHIAQIGWHNWDRLVTQSTTSYEEYNSLGPGGNLRNRVTWAKTLTDEEVKEYTPGNIFGLDFNYEFYKS